MSSKKRVSVFARLGPAGPASPDEAVPPPHRRYSSDKGHHTHPLPPPPIHSAPHPHSHPRDREDTLRERKSSHQDYEEKKQLHYRDVPPPPLPPPSSRHRSRKHYHDDPPDHLDYPNEPLRDLSRSEKRSSLPLSLAPPPPPRKSRDLTDRLSPTGKDILSKPFMGYDDKTKMHRGGGEGGRGAGGKGKKTTPPGGKRGTPSEGGTGSEGEAGEGGEEGQRKRSRTEKKSKQGGGQDEVGRRPGKTHYPLEREREGRERERGERERRERGERERGVEEMLERERHGWLPEKHPPLPTVPLAEGGGEGGGGGGDVKEGRPRPERGGGRGEEREGRRKREEDWPEPRELVRKRRREGAEGNSTPPPDSGTKRVKTGDNTTDKESPAVLSREEQHLRNDPDLLERKRRYETLSDEAGPPLSKKLRSSDNTSSASSGRKHSRADLGSVALSATAGGSVRKKTDHHHKGGAEQDHTPETGEGAKVPPKLDWSSISALSLPKPKPASTSAVQRFSPGAVFSRVGVSRSLVGPSLYSAVSSAVSTQLVKEQETMCIESGNRLPESLVEQPFGDSEFAMTGVSLIRNAKENCRVCVNIGANRQALVASADFALRRKLGKASKGLLPPSPSSSATWNSEHFARAVLLYNSLGTKASGKPAFRLEPSLVGSLLIPK